jgi:hypothetical protein
MTTTESANGPASPNATIDHQSNGTVDPPVSQTKKRTSAPRCPNCGAHTDSTIRLNGDEYCAGCLCNLTRRELPGLDAEGGRP